MGRKDLHGDVSWRVAQTTRRATAEEALEGYARVAVDSLERLHRRAGALGVFLTRARKEQPQLRPVVWMPRAACESDL
eukprot:3613825-Alexandrium_andersonii.AAC.1